MSVSLLEDRIRTLGLDAVTAALAEAGLLETIVWAWEALARPAQLPPPGDWRVWVIQAGRGFGKTRSGAEWARARAREMPGSIGALVGQTPEEVRRVQIEGPAGILAVCPPDERPEWEPSKGVLLWPNGTRAEVFSGANPESLRGPQHHWAWVDEFAKFKRARETLDHLSLGLRLEGPHGEQPRAVFTTTPRPIAALRDLLKRPTTVVTRGSTYENKANLAKSFLDEVREAYEGTRLGRQELGGEMLEDVPGALWKRAWFDADGFRRRRELEEFELICVAIDPAASSDPEESDETGIVGAGSTWVDGHGDVPGRKHFHVLADRSLVGSPSERSRAAIGLFQELEADRLVVEVNNGGDWIPAALASEWEAMGLPGVAPVEVVHASRGKRVRAEPISGLYEQRRVTHEPGLEGLEDQLATWSPLLGDASPDRLDALVWALTWLDSAKRLVAT